MSSFTVVNGCDHMNSECEQQCKIMMRRKEDCGKGRHEISALSHILSNQWEMYAYVSICTLAKHLKQSNVQITPLKVPCYSEFTLQMFSNNMCLKPEIYTPFRKSAFCDVTKGNDTSLISFSETTSQPLCFCPHPNV